MPRRPLSDKRPFGPFIELSNAEPMDVEIREGPIWTWVEVTTFAGSREESPTVDSDHVEFVDRTVTDVMLSDDVKERLEFVGEINEFDILCERSGDLTVSCFIRHAEDFISIRLLDGVIDVLQPRINEHKDLTMRDYRAVSEEFVEQKHPEIV